MHGVDDDRPKPRPTHVVGEDLSLLSVAELGERVALLKEEIERLEAAKAAKNRARGAADSVFRL